MIVADNNALSAYLKVPPLFSEKRDAAPLFPVAPPRPVPSATGDHGNEREERRGSAGAALDYREREPSAHLTPHDLPELESDANSEAGVVELHLTSWADGTLEPATQRTLEARSALLRTNTPLFSPFDQGTSPLEPGEQARAAYFAAQAHLQRTGS